VKKGTAYWLRYLSDAMGTGWLIDGIQKMEGVTLTDRQDIAIERLLICGDWIEEEGILPAILSTIQEELDVFLKEGGARPPHYKPPTAADRITLDVYDLRQRMKALTKALKAGDTQTASVSAFVLGKFLYAVLYHASIPALDADGNMQLWRTRGGQRKKDQAMPLHADWQRRIDRCHKSYPSIKSFAALCKLTVNELSKNPTTGTRYNWAYLRKVVKNPLAKKSS